jgi:hypothetical protein
MTLPGLVGQQGNGETDQSCMPLHDWFLPLGPISRKFEDSAKEPNARPRIGPAKANTLLA